MCGQAYGLRYLLIVPVGVREAAARGRRALSGLVRHSTRARPVGKCDRRTGETDAKTAPSQD